MKTIQELNETRTRLQQQVNMSGAQNVAQMTAAERLASHANYKLLVDAYMKAEGEYQAAINSLSADELAALAAQ
jgi:hypothetical protein